MSTHHKSSKQKRSEHDRESNRNFLIVLAVATVALMVIMYLVFVR